MFIRGIFLISFALFIDFLQLAMGWVAFGIGVGLQAMTPIGGAAAGATAGAVACYNSSQGLLQGVVDATKCAFAGGISGAALSAIGMPLGFAMGILFDVVISITLGGGLIFLLGLMGMFYPKYVWSAGIFEMIPGFDVLPGWTFMVILCLMKKKGEEGKEGVVTTVARAVSSAGATSINKPVYANRGVTAGKNAPNNTAASTRNSSNQTNRTPMELKSPRVTDIIPRQPAHPANDNHPYVQKAA